MNYENILSVFSMSIFNSIFPIGCFLLTLVLGFPTPISTPPQIITRKEQGSDSKCQCVEEAGFIIEPDASGRDNIPIVPEPELLPHVPGPTESPTFPDWCQYSSILYWWCIIGSDQFPQLSPKFPIPIQTLHGLNESECFFLSGVGFTHFVT